MFTGDRSGDWLFRALYRAGFASQSEATCRADGLELRDAFITAAVRCAPPANRPHPVEREACRPFLERELALLSRSRVLVALGGFAFAQVLRIWRRAGGAVPRPAPGFRHGVELELGASSSGLPAVTLIGSYHPSQQNTFTGTLTEPMFDGIWARSREVLAD